MTAIRRDCAKTLSYAAVHFTVAFGVIYLLTGSVPIATGVALLEPLANTVAYFLHERAWGFLDRRTKDKGGAMSSGFDLLLACYRSGQMTERQWQKHLKDERLRQWLEKQGHTTPT